MWKKILNRFKKEKRQFNIIVIGLDNSGKTTIIKYLRQGGEGDSSTTPTMGASFHTVFIENIKFDITDLGGQKDFRPLWKKPILSADAIIFVVDVMDTERYAESKEEFDKAVNYLRDEKNEKHVPIFVAANKCDLLASDISFSKKKGELIGFFKLTDFLGSKNTWQLQMTSAISGDGLIDMMIWIFNQLSEKKIKDNLLDIHDFLIFNKNGIPIISKSILLKEDLLMPAFLSAINAFAEEMCKTNGNNTRLSEITLSQYRILFSAMDEILGAIIINITGDVGEAKETLERLMDRFRGKELSEMSEEEIEEYYRKKILSEIVKTSE